MTEGRDDWGFETRAVRAGQARTNEQENSEPLFLTSSFTYTSAAQAAARFAGEEAGYIYSRFTNPTVRNFEQRLAALEGGEACIATASGMSAILAAVMGLLSQGDRIVASRSLFGTSIGLFGSLLPKFGVETRFVDLTDYEAWQAAIDARTRMLFLETPSNPLAEVADIAVLADMAHAAGAWLVVDNCYCTPALQRPIELGADLVIHSATKYLDGQGRCVGGAVVGPAALLDEQVFGFLRTAGPSMSAFNAWVFLKGLETLSLRMKAHCDNALALARWLEAHPAVKAVHYPGLASHPQHALAGRQQSGYGGVLSFEVRGGREGAWRVIDAAQICSITGNLGDMKTTITHPPTTTHYKLTAEELARVRITDDMVRVSVGLENVEDLQRDLARGLDAL